MSKIKTLTAPLLLTGLLLITPLYASVETTTVGTLQLSGSPLDTTVSGDGKFFFVLSDKNKVDIYTANGELKDSIKVDKPADRINASASGDTIFLTNTKSSSSEIISISYIQDIATEGSPFKGPADASVIVSVFSDFQ